MSTNSVANMKLVVIAGRDKGKEFPLPEEGTLVIGRDATSGTRLNDLRVSRTHCEVKVDGDEVTITDSNSTLGTFVNKQRITEHQLLPDDVIQVGDTELRLEVEDLAALKTYAGPNRLLHDLLPPSRSESHAAAQQPLNELVGTVLAHYKVGEVLARGQSGVVFRARDINENREAALKVALPEFSKSDAEMQRYLRTLQPLLSLRHPNLVALYDANKTGSYCWTAMEYVEGESLPQVIQRTGFGMLDWQHVLRIAVHLSQALSFLHQHQIVHRTIVPRHVLIKSSDRLTKLGGLAGAQPLEGVHAEPHPAPGEYLRNLVYLPPERVRGDRHGDVRSDIYSLGATMYNLLTGRPPCEGSEMPDIIAKILQAEPPSPKEFQLSLPDRFERVVLRMLAKRPDDRYQTPAQLLDDLAGVTKSSVPPAAPGIPLPGPEARPGTSGKILVTCACGQALQAREKYAGTRVKCPACGTMLLLPGKIGIRPVTDPPAPPQPPARLPAPDGRRDPGVAPTSKLVTVVAVVVVAAVLAFLGVLSWVKTNPSTPGEKEPAKKAGAAEAGKQPTSPAPGEKPTKS